MPPAPATALPPGDARRIPAADVGPAAAAAVAAPRGAPPEPHLRGASQDAAFCCIGTGMEVDPRHADPGGKLNTCPSPPSWSEPAMQYGPCSETETLSTQLCRAPDLGSAPSKCASFDATAAVTQPHAVDTKKCDAHAVSAVELSHAAGFIAHRKCSGWGKLTGSSWTSTSLLGQSWRQLEHTKTWDKVGDRHMLGSPQVAAVASAGSEEPPAR